jgi:hypothetical protein
MAVKVMKTTGIQAMLTFDMDIFNLKMLMMWMSKNSIRLVLNRFTALENLVVVVVEIYRTWKSIRDYIEASGAESLGYELKQHVPWFNEEYSEL